MGWGGVIYIIFLIILINIYFLYLSGHWYVPAIQSTKWSLYGDWNATEIHLSRHTYRRHSATIKPQCSRLKKFFFFVMYCSINSSALRCFHSLPFNETVSASLPSPSANENETLFSFWIEFQWQSYYSKLCNRVVINENCPDHKFRVDSWGKIYAKSGSQIIIEGM